jgi:hypothetical protein
MGGYSIQPNDNWTIADSATVTLDGIVYENVPIIRIRDTPATITIRTDRFDDGVVILNEVLPPDNDTEVPIVQGQGFVKENGQVEIGRGGDWPDNITLAMFKRDIKWKT